MSNLKKIAIILLAVSAIFAIKPYYGGEVTIRLNEPDDFIYNPSNYSSLIFYSLIYENFFYLKKNGDIISNIFQDYRYDKQTLTLTLHLKNDACFSNGKSITADNINGSLKLFMDMNLASARKLRRMIKQIRPMRQENQALIELMYDDPNVVGLLTAPELVLITGRDDVFSGMFYPAEWEKNRYIILKPNSFYPGGRTFLDSVKVVFYNDENHYPDLFLADPGVVKEKFNEFNSGAYQNIYLVFPGGKESNISGNARIAMYSLLKDFFKSQGARAKASSPGNTGSYSNMSDLNTLTSNDESPVALNIKTFPNWKARSVLKSSNDVQLYILSSLKSMDEPFREFLKKDDLSVAPIYLRDDQLLNFMSNTPVKYLLMGKTFYSQAPIEEKIKKILKEMSFDRFDETYLKLLNQLDEVKNLKNDELTMNLVSKIIEKIAEDEIIMPLFQKRYSLFIKNHIKGIEMDFFGRPLFREARVK